MLNTVLRAVRSVLRHPLRTALVALLLALGIGFSMSMLVVDAAVTDRIDELKAQFGNDIEVRPAGFFGGAAGFGGGGFAQLGPGDQNGEDDASSQPTISSEVLDQIEALPSVSSVQKTAQAQYAGDELASSPPAGSNFGGTTPPITIIGTSTSNRLDVVGGGTAQIIEGTTFPATHRRQTKRSIPIPRSSGSTSPSRTICLWDRRSTWKGNSRSHWDLRC